MFSGQRSRCWGGLLPTKGGWAAPTLGPAVCLLLRPATGTSVSVSPITRFPSGGGRDPLRRWEVCVHGPLYWTAPLWWEVCVHGSPSLDSDPVHEGVSRGHSPQALCVHLQRRGAPCPFLWDLSPLHICSINAHPHWRRKWQPLPVFLPRESHGRRGLVGYSPWVANSRI